MKSELLHRRHKMLTLKSQGVPLKSIVADFTKEYGVSPQALYKDWRKRETWARHISRIKDPVILDEMVQGIKQVLPNAWYEYKMADNSNAKIGALRLIKDLYGQIIDILQSAGMIERVPERAEIKAALEVIVSPTLISDEDDA